MKMKKKMNFCDKCFKLLGRGIKEKKEKPLKRTFLYLAPKTDRHFLQNSFFNPPSLKERMRKKGRKEKQRREKRKGKREKRKEKREKGREGKGWERKSLHASYSFCCHRCHSFGIKS